MDELNKYINTIIKNKIVPTDDINVIEMTPLTDGGSNRYYYRISLGDKRTIIYMKYSSKREENNYYCNISNFLNSINVNVPKLYYHDEGNVFMEDLGNDLLYDLVKSKRGDIVGYYRNVIDQLILLHLKGRAAYQKSPFKISSGFDSKLYKWESKYFIDNLVKGFFGLDVNNKDVKSIENDFNVLAECLSDREKVLIHRDCQSKNIVVRDNIPYLIDFQGLRLGLLQYDLASLLEDPYIEIPKNDKDYLINYYLDKTSFDRDEFLKIYRYCSIQRLMQALGAYAFLGIKKGKKEFLSYIPSGLNKLDTALNMDNNLTAIKEFVKELAQGSYPINFTNKAF